MPEIRVRLQLPVQFYNRGFPNILIEKIDDGLDQPVFVPEVIVNCSCVPGASFGIDTSQRNGFDAFFGKHRHGSHQNCVPGVVGLGNCSVRFSTPRAWTRRCYQKNLNQMLESFDLQNLT